MTSCDFIGRGLSNHILGSLPPLRERRARQDLGDAGPRCGSRVLGKTIERKKAVGGDFVIGFGRVLLAKGAHDKDRNMVALRHPSVEEQAMELGRPKNLNIALFKKLACEGLGRRFAGLDPATRQLPPMGIGVGDEKNSLVIVDDEATDAKRHPAGKPPIKVEGPADQRLNR